MADAKRLPELEAELSRLREIEAFHRDTFVARLEARVANPMPDDDIDRLTAELESARRDCVAFSERARAVQEEIDAMRAAERERRYTERSELVQAAFKDAKKADAGLRQAARYEKALVQILERLSTYDDVDPAARYFKPRHLDHFAAMHAANLETDSSIPAMSYEDRLRALVPDGDR